MNFIHKIRVLFVILLFLFINAYPQLLHYKTKNLDIIYTNENQFYLIPHLAASFENSFSFHKKYFDYTPKEPMSTLFHDFGDWGYGGASNIPANTLVIGIEPFDYSYDVMPSNERFGWLMNHELTHITLCDKPNSLDNFFRSLFFGKVSPTSANPLSFFYSYLTSPRRFSARWYHEGIAVFFETWMSGGVGRTLGGYDEMVFRTMVQDKNYFYNAVGLESEGTTIDFQVGMNSYLYGSRFVSYLAFNYGIDKLKQWYDRSDSSYKYYATQFENVYNNNLRSEWDNWIKFEKDFQKENLSLIQKYPVTELKYISNESFGSASKFCFDYYDNKLISAINSYGQLSHIAKIDIATGERTKITDMPSPALYYVASIAFDDSSKTLFFTTNNSQNWRTLNSYDLIKKEKRTLLSECRIGDISFNKNDKSLWGTQHNNGITYLVRIAYPYQNWQAIYSFQYGTDFFDLDISPNGELLSGTFSFLNGAQQLVAVNTDSARKGYVHFDSLYVFENNSASNFVFSKDGKYLYGSSYLTGVSNIFQYSFESKKMDILTNSETGLFRPLDYSTDSLIAMRYSTQGFLPVIFKKQILYDVNAVNYLGQRVIEKNPELKNFKSGSPALIPIDSLKVFSGNYSPLNNFKLNSVYPIIEGYQNFVGYGLSFAFHDPFMLLSTNINFSYSPNINIPLKQRFHSSINLKYWYWDFEAAFNKADFYDLFGPTKFSRAGYQLSFGYNDVLIYQSPERMDYNLNLSYYGDLERLPEYQEISSSYDKLLSASGNIKYAYSRRTLGGIEEEAGYSFQLNFKSNYINNTIFPRIWLNADFGILLPLNHSSIWFRTSFGNSFAKDREETAANFYFGGFGNNWIDNKEIRRYRHYYSLPGRELNYLAGTNFGKLLLEWDLPPVHFNEIGFLSFYITYARLSFFSAGIVTNLDDYNLRKKMLSVGSQLDFELVLFSLMKSTLSFGYAMSFEKSFKPNKEFMVSLKIQ